MLILRACYFNRNPKFKIVSDELNISQFEEFIKNVNACQGEFPFQKDWIK